MHVYIVLCVRHRKIFVGKSLERGLISQTTVFLIHVGGYFFLSVIGPSGLVLSLCRTDEIPTISTGDTHAKRVNTINTITTANRTRDPYVVPSYFRLGVFSFFFLPFPTAPGRTRIRQSCFHCFFSRLYSGSSASNRIPKTYHTAMGLCTCAKPRRTRRTIRVRPHTHTHISVL